MYFNTRIVVIVFVENDIAEYFQISYITPVVEAVFAFAEALNNRSTHSLQTKLQDLQ